MAERSQFWTTGTTGDGTSQFSQQQLLEWLRDTFTSDQFSAESVLAGVGGQLLCTGVSGASPSMSVATGAAYVYGFYYQSTTASSLSITKPTIGTTGGRVVLRADWTAQTVRLIVRQSADGTSTPPAATQTPGTTYEVSLCTYTVTTGGTVTVTDVRDFCHPGQALIYRRLGGSAIDWGASGTTTFTPGAMRMIAGSTSLTFPSSSSSNTITVTLPITFSGTPIVLACVYSNGSSTGRKVVPTIRAVTTTTFQLEGYVTDGASTSSSFDVFWIAIGPK